MAYRVVSNRKGNGVVLHVTSNSVIELTALADDAQETVTGAAITQAAWGSGGGGGTGGPPYWRVKRGANTILTLDSTGYQDYAGNGMSIDLDKGGNFVIDLVGTLEGALVLEVQKTSNIANNQYLVG